jgi:hypothetical protein
MEVWKVVLRLWALLSLLSWAIAGACIWLDGIAAGSLHNLYDTYHVSHVTIFMFAVAAPFVLAVVMPILGVFLVFIRWSVGIGAPEPRPRREPLTPALATPARVAKDAA